VGFPFREDDGLLLAQEQIDYPTTSDMLPRLAAVGENVGVGAARFFKGVAQDGKNVKSSFLVDGLGHSQDGPIGAM